VCQTAEETLDLSLRSAKRIWFTRLITPREVGYTPETVANQLTLHFLQNQLSPPRERSIRVLRNRHMRAIALIIVATGLMATPGGAEETRWLVFSQPTLTALSQLELDFPSPSASFQFAHPPRASASAVCLVMTDLPDAIGQYAIALPWATANPIRNPLTNEIPIAFERIDRRTIKFDGGSHAMYRFGYTLIVIIMDTTICDLFCGLESPTDIPFKNGAFSVLRPQWPPVQVIYCR
jgi:hypothetical protein